MPAGLWGWLLKASPEMAETLGGSGPPLRSLWFFCHCPEWHLVWILLRASAGSTHLTRGYTSLRPFLLYSSVNCEPVTGPLGFRRSLKLNSRLYYPGCVAWYSEILTGCSLYSVILYIIVLGYLNICGYYRVCSYGNNFPLFPLICLLVVSVSVFLTVGLTLSACTTSFYSARNSSRTGKFTQYSVIGNTAPVLHMLHRTRSGLLLHRSFVTVNQQIFWKPQSSGDNTWWEAPKWM